MFEIDFHSLRKVLIGKDLEQAQLLDPPLHQSDIANVFRMEGFRQYVAKVYRHPTDDMAERVSAMIDCPLDDLRQALWPLDRLMAIGSFQTAVGYVMFRIESAQPLTEFWELGARIPNVGEVHFGHRVEAARSLASAVRLVHESGQVIGSLRPDNVLINRDRVAVLAACDSWQFRTHNRLFPCSNAHAGYATPGMQDDNSTPRSQGHDCFALGVIIYQILHQGAHPFAGRFEGMNVADEATPAASMNLVPSVLRELFQRCFVTGLHNPQLCPNAAMWQNKLTSAAALLHVCSNNADHVFNGELEQCPSCGGSGTPSEQSDVDDGDPSFGIEIPDSTSGDQSDNQPLPAATPLPKPPPTPNPVVIPRQQPAANQNPPGVVSARDKQTNIPPPAKPTDLQRQSARHGESDVILANVDHGPHAKRTIVPPKAKITALPPRAKKTNLPQKTGHQKETMLPKSAGPGKETMLPQSGRGEKETMLPPDKRADKETMIPESDLQTKSPDTPREKESTPVPQQLPPATGEAKSGTPTPQLHQPVQYPPEQEKPSTPAGANLQCDSQGPVLKQPTNFPTGDKQPESDDNQLPFASEDFSIHLKDDDSGTGFTQTEEDPLHREVASDSGADVSLQSPPDPVGRKLQKRHQAPDDRKRVTAPSNRQSATKSGNEQRTASGRQPDATEGATGPSEADVDLSKVPVPTKRKTTPGREAPPVPSPTASTKQQPNPGDQSKKNAPTTPQPNPGKQPVKINKPAETTYPAPKNETMHPQQPDARNEKDVTMTAEQIVDDANVLAPTVTAPRPALAKAPHQSAQPLGEKTNRVSESGQTVSEPESKTEAPPAPPSKYVKAATFFGALACVAAVVMYSLGLFPGGGKKPGADDPPPGPSPSPALVRTVVWIEEQINKHLEKNVAPPDCKHCRFFTFVSFQKGGKLFSQPDLKKHRNALFRLIEHFSPKKNVSSPIAVGEGKIIYMFDLRSWGDQGRIVWDKILEHYPYALRFGDSNNAKLASTAKKNAELMGNAVCVIRADWFVARALDKDMYKTILEITKANNKKGNLENDIADTKKHYDKPLTIEQAANELGMIKDKLSERIRSNQKLRDLGLTALTQGHQINRATWDSLESGLSLFQIAARELELGAPYLVIR